MSSRFMALQHKGILVLSEAEVSAVLRHASLLFVPV